MTIVQLLTVTISKAIADTSGNTMASDYIFQFYTVTALSLRLRHRRCFSRYSGGRLH